MRGVTEYEKELWKPLLIETCAWANLSPDPSTQNGAMLVQLGASHHPEKVLRETLSVNEFPKGVQYLPERWERPLKYSVIEHAERNAIFSAAKQGIKTEGLALVCPWAACCDCARAIIQAGIRILVTVTPRSGATPDRWDESVKVAMAMLDEAHVRVIFIDGPLDTGFEIRRDGKPFTP